MVPVSISKPEHSMENGWFVASASVTIDGKSYQLKYKVSEGPLAKGSEPFLAAALLPAMKVAQPMQISGTVSPKLLTATQTIQEIFHKWFPSEFQKIQVQTEPDLQDAVSHGTEVGAFFSGGVDSFYTFLKHQDEITKIILIHGFNRYYSDALRLKVTKHIRWVARELGKPLIEVETNVRQLSDQYADYTDHYVGSMLASVGLLLSPQFRKIYIPATNSYEYLEPEGTHPILDPLWSTEYLTFEHDGCEAYRVEKIARIAQSDIALRSLRVCFENRDDAFNCGRCEKCIRTMVGLKAAGALERCTTFNEKLDIKAVSSLKIRHHGKIPYVEENLRALENSGKHPDLAEALRICIKDYRHDQLLSNLNENLNEFLASIQGVRFMSARKNTIFRSLCQAERNWLLREVLKEKLKEIDEKFFFGILRKINAPDKVKKL
jgi:7-cyano-7-deazaguanine synthase in queuosine biosynthesis